MGYTYTNCTNEPQSEKTNLLTFEPNKDSDQPLHMRSLTESLLSALRTLHPLLSKMHPVKILIRLQMQSDLNLKWAHMFKGTFSDIGAEMFTVYHVTIFTLNICTAYHKVWTTDSEKKKTFVINKHTCRTINSGSLLVFWAKLASLGQLGLISDSQSNSFKNPVIKSILTSLKSE